MSTSTSEKFQNVQILNSLVVPEFNDLTNENGGLYLLSENTDVTGYLCVASNESGKCSWIDADLILTLENLSDVDITNPQNGQVLTYENGLWINTFSGVANTLQSLVDVDVTPPIPGYSLTFDGNTNLWEQELKQTQIITPTITSANVTASAVGNNINYAITADTNFLSYFVQDDDGTGITTIGNGPILQGGAGTPIGSYDLILRCGNDFGISDPFVLTWTVF